MPEPTLFFTIACATSPEPSGETPCGTMIHASLPIDDKVLAELEEDGWIMAAVPEPDGKTIIMPMCPECAAIRGIDKELAQGLGHQRRGE